MRLLQTQLGKVAKQTLRQGINYYQRKFSMDPAVAELASISISLMWLPQFMLARNEIQFMGTKSILPFQ